MDDELVNMEMKHKLSCNHCGNKGDVSVVIGHPGSIRGWKWNGFEGELDDERGDLVLIYCKKCGKRAA